MYLLRKELFIGQFYTLLSAYIVNHLLRLISLDQPFEKPTFESSFIIICFKHEATIPAFLNKPTWWWFHVRTSGPWLPQQLTVNCVDFHWIVNISSIFTGEIWVTLASWMSLEKLLWGHHVSRAWALGPGLMFFNAQTLVQNFSVATCCYCKWLQFSI